MLNGKELENMYQCSPPMAYDLFPQYRDNGWRYISIPSRADLIGHRVLVRCCQKRTVVLKHSADLKLHDENWSIVGEATIYAGDCQNCNTTFWTGTDVKDAGSAGVNS